jgi:hypothetical protein
MVALAAAVARRSTKLVLEVVTVVAVAEVAVGMALEVLLEVVAPAILLPVLVVVGAEWVCVARAIAEPVAGVILVPLAAVVPGVVVVEPILAAFMAAALAV